MNIMFDRPAPLFERKRWRFFIDRWKSKFAGNLADAGSPEPFLVAVVSSYGGGKKSIVDREDACAAFSSCPSNIVAH